MAFDDRPEAVLSFRPRGADGRENAAAACVQLLVARARGAERELVDTVAAERRVRVAVDEAGNRAQAATVQLTDVAVERRQVAHAADGLDRVARAEDVRVLDQLDLAERRLAQGCVDPGRRGHLHEVADEQPGHASCGADGIFSPPRSAASIASG